jgi:hypothetical protein
VQNLGAGDVVWDCEFRTAEACAPHVIAGNRGFCNINPSFCAAALRGADQTPQAPLLKNAPDIASNRAAD